MKKTSLTLFAAFITATTIVNAQKIKWTGEQSNGGEIVRSIIGYDTSGYYVYRCPEAVSGGVAISGNVIEKRNYDNNVIFSKDVDVSLNGEQCYYVKAVIMKNGPVIIVFNKKDKGYYAVNINKDGSLGNSTLIMDDNNLSLFGYAGNFISALQQDDYATHTVVSADKSFLLAYHVDKGHKTVSMAVFGSDLKQTWARDLAFEQSNFKLDKKNQIAAALTKGDKAFFFTVNTGEKGAWPLYSMYTVGSSGAPQKTDITPDGDKARMTSVDFKISHAGDILIAALTRKYNPSKGYDEEGATGYCIMRIDASSGKISLNKTQDFDNALLLKYCSQKKIEKGYGILRLSINRVVENPDKSILLFSEQDGYGVYSSPMEGQTVRPLPYTPPGAKYSGSMDVVIIKVNPDGSYAWAQDIPKNQCFDNISVYPMYASRHLLTDIGETGITSI